MIYIGFEGPDGTGKSTLARYVHNILAGGMITQHSELRELIVDLVDSKKIHFIKEPSEKYRKILMDGVCTEAELLTFFADRAEIFNNLPDDSLVVADRTHISSLIYQTILQSAGNIGLYKTLVEYTNIPQIDQLFTILSNAHLGSKTNKFDAFDQDELEELYLRETLYFPSYVQNVHKIQNKQGEYEATLNDICTLLKLYLRSL